MSTFETPQLQAPSLGTPTRPRNDGRLYVELKTATPPAKTLDTMRVNLARGLKPLGPCKPHGEVVSIAAGRPSLADTFGEMQGHVAAGNGSLGYLIERGVTPHFCVVIDAMPHMAEIVVPDNGVYYLLSTRCDHVSSPANVPPLAGPVGARQGEVAAGKGCLAFLVEHCCGGA